ncbi:MAG: SDR family oxidoreductase [Chloroflexota bacterium]
MSIVVTGATGNLGRLVIEDLLQRGVEPGAIVAVGRSVDRIADLAARGIVVRAADYTDPASLDAAFAGAERVLLVSGSEVGQRFDQHRNAVEAIVRSGATFLAYTSFPHAPTNTIGLAAEHAATEALIVATGLHHAFLRNSWYLENYLGQVPTYLAHGIAGCAGDGRVSGALRRDYAAAAAAVLATPPGGDRAYELGGSGFTMAELAAELSAQTGRSVSYVDLPEDAYAQMLIGVGLPEPVATMFADADRGISEGELFVAGDDLATLIGRPPVSLADAIRGWLVANPQGVAA